MENNNNHNNNHDNNNMSYPYSHSPMQIGLTGPSPGGTNVFTADELSELMGFSIPSNNTSNSDIHGSGLTQILPHAPHPSQHLRMRINSLDDTDNISTVSTSAINALPDLVLDTGFTAPGTVQTSASAASATTSNNDGKEVRSERKRSREKQRRTDVNKQFNELTDVIKRIETDEQKNQQDIIVREQERDKEYQRQRQQTTQHGDDETTTEEDGSSSNKRLKPTSPSTSSSVMSSCVLPPFSATNRVDLIARTIAHLERLARVTNKQRSDINSLEEQLTVSKKAGEDTASKLKQATTVQMNMANPMMMNNGSMMSPMMMANGGNGNNGSMMMPNNCIPPPVTSSNPMATMMNNNMMGTHPQKPQVRNIKFDCFLSFSL